MSERIGIARLCSIPEALRDYFIGLKHKKYLLYICHRVTIAFGCVANALNRRNE